MKIMEKTIVISELIRGELRSRTEAKKNLYKG